MCGICGLYDPGEGSAAGGNDALLAMREALAHRGPDDSGFWSEGPVAFGFRRLSILDLEGGHQPMRSADGRLTIIFNGEIYNHPELRSELEASGAAYRTRSDTETILHLYEQNSDPAVLLRRLNGMFAVALWDRGRRRLLLARDPVGVKPFYYWLGGGGRLVFASELRALLAGGVPEALDPGAVMEYLEHGFVHAPRTILAGVRKLPPGHFLALDADGMRVEPYINIGDEFPGRANGASEFDGTGVEDAARGLESRLAAAVRRQLLSDVPVGAFLSGGVDSSLIASLMRRELGRRIPTFTIGFSGVRSGLDESAHARRVARHLGTDHHELILPADVLDRVEDLVPSLDEPIADSAILPTFLLARFARESVKVVLTGEGADELFAGYARYKASYWSGRIQALPRPLAAGAAALLRTFARGREYAAVPMATVRDWARTRSHCSRLSLKEICRPEFWEQGGVRAWTPWFDPGELDRPHSLGRAQLFDLRTVLCDALLMKVDKATMRASLEARVPYLDPGVVGFAEGLPENLKLRRLKGKYLLRRVAARFLPPEIAWRRKHGFVVPWEEWVRGSGHRRIDELLVESKLSRQGFLDIERLRTMRRLLTQGAPEGDAGLFFRIIVLGLWLEEI
ncbi:MAG: asparagine synthase (glutamine-hydrolyzing) [Elusimicrobia bacterium]|nr:asparagine synthase (glutamine-hydrolyzing) [Elusimicrobiota bacterium]